MHAVIPKLLLDIYRLPCFIFVVLTEDVTSCTLLYKSNGHL